MTKEEYTEGSIGQDSTGRRTESAEAVAGVSARRSVLLRIWRFYRDGFREMTVGKTLWAIILVKLFIMFFILKLFFFPNVLSRDYDSDEERAEAVRHNLVGDRR